MIEHPTEDHVMESYDGIQEGEGPIPVVLIGLIVFTIVAAFLLALPFGGEREYPFSWWNKGYLLASLYTLVFWVVMIVLIKQMPKDQSKDRNVH